MRKYFDPILYEIYSYWVLRIKVEFPNSRYANFTIADFFEERKGSKDIPFYYNEMFWYMDHHSLLPTKKSIREKQKNRWLNPVKALATLM